jgi:hypothetical protein
LFNFPAKHNLSFYAADDSAVQLDHIHSNNNTNVLCDSSFQSEDTTLNRALSLETRKRSLRGGRLVLGHGKSCHSKRASKSLTFRSMYKAPKAKFGLDMGVYL